MKEFHQSLSAYQQRINQVLEQYLAVLPVNASPLIDAMSYGVLLGGKRLRPYLVYSSGQLFGLPLATLDPAAAAIECLHAYSLIHDDLPAMDNDSLRRGHPTCHLRFGEANAILAGDALQALAFSILCDSPMTDVRPTDHLLMLSELASASGASGMCAGQALDLAAEGQQISLAQLELIHRHKTGALIRASVRLGALAAGESGRAALPALDRYADAIGLAFQVQDDILDVIGETAKTGKHQGHDQTLGKSTYPALLGIEQARDKAYDLHREALAALAELSDQAYDVTPLGALAAFIIERDN